MRRILYISGTRADFGLMRGTLHALAASPDIHLSIVVTGMHLSALYGHTVDEVETSGLEIVGRVPVDLQPATGATMSRGIATMMAGFTDILVEQSPDIVLLLGDRGEMLAAAVAAIHLNIPIAHIHGGERSGTVDEPIRHAISKLSHIHLAATPGARDRIVRLGEDPACVHVTGAPGIDGLADAAKASREAVVRRYLFDPDRRMALMIYHPVLQHANEAAAEASRIVDALRGERLQAVIVMPNADAGSDEVRGALEAYGDDPDMRLVTHLPRDAFVEAMARADVMVGNSSAGIIEAATFGTPVVNVGNRQAYRERNANVVDVASSDDVANAVRRQLEHGRIAAPINLYGDGKAAERIVAILRDAALDASLLDKINAY